VRKAGSPVIGAKAAAAAAPAETSTRASNHHSEFTTLHYVATAVGMGFVAKVAAFLARLALYGVLINIFPGAKLTASLAAAVAAEASGCLALVWSLIKIALMGAVIIFIIISFVAMIACLDNLAQSFPHRGFSSG
jgi:hypothetical protein